jgi:hypothetical protein
MRAPAATVTGPATAAAAAVFGALAERRRARALHPDGAAFRARLHVTGGAGLGVPLLDEARTWEAVVRLSRALGTPDPLPDAFGLALRVPGAHGPGRPQDLLLTTSVDLPLLHHLVLPSLAGIFGQSYSSALPYRIGGRLGALGARAVRRRRGAGLDRARLAAAAGDARFALCVAWPLSRWRPVAELVLGEPLEAAAAEALAFDPAHAGGGLEPVHRLMPVRRAAYAASQTARPGAEPLPD